MFLLNNVLVELVEKFNKNKAFLSVQRLKCGPAVDTGAKFHFQAIRNRSVPAKDLG